MYLVYKYGRYSSKKFTFSTRITEGISILQWLWSSGRFGKQFSTAQSDSSRNEEIDVENGMILSDNDVEIIKRHSIACKVI